MQQKSISGKELSNTITSEDILGKDVIDVDGAFIGIAEKIFIDQKSMDFIGISIDKGLIRRGLTIGKDYIGKIEDYAIFLNIKVAYDIQGMLVFDKNGKKVGKVASIDLYGNKNKIKTLYVRPSALLFLKEKIIIPIEDVDNIGDNVILNVSIDELPNK